MLSEREELMDSINSIVLGELTIEARLLVFPSPIVDLPEEPSSLLRKIHGPELLKRTKST